MGVTAKMRLAITELTAPASAAAGRPWLECRPTPRQTPEEPIECQDHRKQWETLPSPPARKGERVGGTTRPDTEVAFLRKMDPRAAEFSVRSLVSSCSYPIANAKNRAVNTAAIRLAFVREVLSRGTKTRHHRYRGRLM